MVTVTSVGRDAVEACRRGQSTGGAKIHERSVDGDAEHPDGAGTRVQRVEIASVGTDRDVEVRRAGRVRTDDRAADRSQRAACADLEARDRAAAGIRVVYEAAVGGDDVPAVRRS